jgi:hypothetical protein
MNFHENLFNSFRVVKCERTDIHDEAQRNTFVLLVEVTPKCGHADRQTRPPHYTFIYALRANSLLFNSVHITV